MRYLTVLEWQKSVLAQLTTNAMPQALLLHGKAGTGKHDFALALAQKLLCSAPLDKAEAEHACGVCQPCVWYAQGHHPDFKWLTPENDDADEATTKRKTKKTIISVAQVRQLGDFLTLSNHQSALRIIVISPADALNTQSANALLKMLEEPPAGTLFILVTSQLQRLLPTIRSRCQLLSMPVPSQQQAVDWLIAQGLAQPESLLHYAGGAPLQALQLAQEASHQLISQHLAQGARLNPNAAAGLLIAVGAEQALTGLQKWVYDLFLFAATQQTRYFQSHANAMQRLTKSVKLSALLQFDKTLRDAKKMANHPLNHEMQLENLLVQYTACFA